MNTEVIEQLLSQLQTKPIHEIMRQNERDAGYEPVLPGTAPWFSARDWRPTDVVSTDGKIVRIVAICARKPGSGAFRRMVNGIVAAGLEPVVIEPFPVMEAILTRWGWAGKLVGSGIDRYEEWRAA